LRLACGDRIKIEVTVDLSGLIRPQALDALRGEEVIIHGGDVGNAEILDRLRGIAPTFAVRGFGRGFRNRT